MNILLILIAVFLFGFIIFIHEFGHFFTAKLSGIRVNEFAIGMGPKIFSKQGKETKYTLRLLPIGGYCAMEGEDEDSDDEGAFGNKPIWKRMLVVVMGAVMNILLGFLLMFVIVVQEDLIAIPQIAQFTEDSYLEEAGAQVNDTFVSVDDYKINTDRDLSFALSLADPEDVTIVLDREGEEVVLENITLGTYVYDDGSEEGQVVTTVDFVIYGEIKTVGNVLVKTYQDTISVARMVFASLKGLLTGEFGFNDVSGPVGAAEAITEAASAGLQTSFMSAVNNIILMMTLITVNLGIFNLLPFPALDGGRFVFLIIEAIARKPVPVKYEQYVNAAGFAILIGFMIVVTVKDVWNLFA